MKGDFTRDTFQPQKHYTAVLMQQGRLQLDADWNEQISIQNDRLQTQIRDLIGNSGTSTQGFSIDVTQDGDLTIAPGYIYVEGTRCELDNTLKYTQQPDYSNAPRPTQSGNYLVYLDVWQRHITTIEDPSIREVALGVPDTATRSQTVWQVKLLRVPEGSTPKAIWDRFQNKPQNRLTARVKSNTDGGILSAGSQQFENRLYRVEVHASDNSDADNPTTGQTTGQITGSKRNFKWSRNNGAIASTIKQIKGNTIVIDNLGREDAQFFAPGQWVEVTDSRRELTHKPGVFVRLTAATVGNELRFDPNTLDGNQAITAANFPKDAQPKVRRWEHNATTDKAVIPLDSDWIPLEAGIEVKFDDFQVNNPLSPYQSGDYWMLPVRANQSLNAIPWQDKSQSPQGIQHHYSLLAEVTFTATPIAFTFQHDRRIIFPTLAECLSRNATLTTDVLGIGLAPGAIAQATLDIQGHSKAGIGTLSSEGNGTPVTQATDEFFKNLALGDQITLATEPPISRIVTTIDRIASTITVDQPFTDGFTDVTFTIQPPTLRLTDSKGQSQITVNAQGKLITVDLDVNGTFKTQTVTTEQLTVKGPATIEGRLTAQQGLKLDGDVVLRSFSTDGTFAQSNDSATPTTQAVKTFVNTEVSGLSTSLMGQINLFRTTLTGEINALDTRLGGQINAFNTTLTGQISALDTRLGGQINTFNTTLNTHINDINSTINTRIDGVSDRVSQNLITLTTKIDDNNTALNTRMNGVSQNLTTQITAVNQALNAKANSQGSTTQDFQTKKLTVIGTLQVQSGATIQTFSTDDNFSLSSDAAVPTEKAVKTYVDRQIDSVNNTLNLASHLSTDLNDRIDDLNQTVNLSLTGKADRNGSTDEDFQTKNLTVLGNLKLSGPIVIQSFSKDSQFSQTSDTTLPTTQAVKTYVDESIIGVDRRITTIAQAQAPKTTATLIGSTIRLGSGINQFSITVPAASGDVVMSTTGEKLTINADVEISGTLKATNLTNASSRSLKSNITSLSSQDSRSLLLDLHPVTFQFLSETSGKTHAGFIAEEVPDLLATEDKKGINAIEIVAILTKTIKDQQETITELEQMIQTHQSQFVKVLDRLTQLEHRKGR